MLTSGILIWDKFPCLSKFTKTNTEKARGQEVLFIIKALTSSIMGKKYQLACGHTAHSGNEPRSSGADLKSR